MNAINKIERVGILGLGKMGSPMARHLLAKGFKVVGYDPSAVAIASARKIELRLAASAREVAAQSDLVIVAGGPHFWMGDPIDEPNSHAGFLAPRLLRFLKMKL